MKHATQPLHPQADVQPGSPAMQAMVTRQCPLLLMPRTTMTASNVERHENARTVPRTTASNVEHHKNARTVPRMMAVEINVDNTNTRTTTLVKVPPLSLVSSESVVAIVPNHVVKVFFFSCVLVDVYINIMLDVVMHSPPKEPIPAYGSSRSMGGSTRG